MFNRLDDMLERYGECCTQARAVQILSKSPRTIYRMLEDGRLRRVGTDVDVCSMAEYLENPKGANFVARRKVRRRIDRWGSFGKSVVQRGEKPKATCFFRCKG